MGGGYETRTKHLVCNRKFVLPIRYIVGHVEKAMNPLCVAITYGVIEPLIKKLDGSKGEQECLDAAKNHESWVSQSEIQALFDKTPPHRFAGIEGFMESKLHFVLDEAMCVVCGKAGELEPRFGYVVCKDHENIPPNQIGKHYGTQTKTGPNHVQEVPAAAQD